MTLVTTRKVGNVEVVALLDGDEACGPIADAFPDVPPDAHANAAERHPGVYAGDDWRLAVRAWLVRHPGGVALVDTGVGPSTAVAMAWFPTPGRLHDALTEAGASADQIDTVVITHVHDDHVGGTVTADGAPAFPNARYLVQQADLDALVAWGEESEEDREIEARAIAPLRASGQLDAIDGHHVLTGDLELRHAPGHTPGHQVLRITSRGDRLLISGDTWNHPSQFGRPEWASATDAEPARATATRRAMLADLLSHPGSVVAPTHLDVPFGRIRTASDGRAAFDALA